MPSPFRRVALPPASLSENAILGKLLEQFDNQKIREQLATHPEQAHDALIVGGRPLDQLMRCVQMSDLDFGDRSLNEILAKALSCTG